MICLNVEDIKAFTAHLFTKETFDNFLLAEAVFATSFTTSFDGRRAEPEEGEAYVSWGEVRPQALSLIKGSRLPRSFRIVLRLSQKKTEEFLSSCRLSFSAGDVGGLYLNIRYSDKKITCMTGCAMQVFRPDKTLEHAFDDQICRLLKQSGIAVSLS